MASHCTVCAKTVCRYQQLWSVRPVDTQNLHTGLNTVLCVFLLFEGAVGVVYFINHNLWNTADYNAVQCACIYRYIAGCLPGRGEEKWRSTIGLWILQSRCAYISGNAGGRQHAYHWRFGDIAVNGCQYHRICTDSREQWKCHHWLDRWTALWPYCKWMLWCFPVGITSSSTVFDVQFPVCTLC